MKTSHTVYHPPHSFYNQLTYQPFNSFFKGQGDTGRVRTHSDKDILVHAYSLYVFHSPRLCQALDSRHSPIQCSFIIYFTVSLPYVLKRGKRRTGAQNLYGWRRNTPAA